MKLKEIQKLVERTELTVDGTRRGDISILINGTIHYECSGVESLLVEQFKPEIILAEELLDSWYCAAKQRFYHGEFYKKHASGVQQRLMDHSPLLYYGENFGLDLMGIDLPQTDSHERRENHFFDKIRQYSAQKKKTYVSVGHFHLQPHSFLRRRLRQLGEPWAVVYLAMGSPATGLSTNGWVIKK